MITCLLCGGPFEGLIAGFTPDGKPHHEDPLECIAWTEGKTVRRCIETIATFERGYTRIPSMLIQRAIRSEFEREETGFDATMTMLRDAHAYLSRKISVAMLAERMRQQNEYEWWKAMEGK